MRNGTAGTNFSVGNSTSNWKSFFSKHLVSVRSVAACLKSTWTVPLRSYTTVICVISEWIVWVEVCVWYHFGYFPKFRKFDGHLFEIGWLPIDIPQMHILIVCHSEWSTANQSSNVHRCLCSLIFKLVATDRCQPSWHNLYAVELANCQNSKSK